MKQNDSWAARETKILNLRITAAMKDLSAAVFLSFLLLQYSLIVFHSFLFCCWVAVFVFLKRSVDHVDSMDSGPHRPIVISPPWHTEIITAAVKWSHTGQSTSYKHANCGKILCPQQDLSQWDVSRVVRVGWIALFYVIKARFCQHWHIRPSAGQSDSRLRKLSLWLKRIDYMQKCSCAASQTSMPKKDWMLKQRETCRCRVSVPAHLGILLPIPGFIGNLGAYRCRIELSCPCASSETSGRSETHRKMSGKLCVLPQH